MAHLKKTIALFISGLDDSYNEALCRGVSMACEENSYNLIVLPGSYINRELDIKSENPYAYQFNTLYSYINPANVSGMIIAAGSIGGYTDKADMVAFLNKYKDIPTVLVSSDYEGFTCINYDNSNGIRDGLEYLIAGGCTRFGVLKGPSGNTEMVERYETFMDVMKKHNIPVSPENIVSVDLSDDNHEICREFLKKNKGIEAISCANDFSALDLCDEIKNLGLVPGRDIKVLGYDNTSQGAKADPPLATISANPINLGQEAVAYLGLKMAGQKTESVNLPATLVVRETLGVSGKGSGSTDSQKSFSEMTVEDAFNYIFYKFNRAGITAGKTAVFSAFSNMVGTLKTLNDMSEVDEDTYQRVTATFPGFIGNKDMLYGDIDNLISYTEHLRMDAIDKAEYESQVNIEYIYQDLYKAILRSVELNNIAATEVNHKKKADFKKFVQVTGNVLSGDDSSYGRLLTCFQWLGAKNGYFYVFDEAITHSNIDSFEPKHEVYLKAFLQDGSLWKLTPDQQRISLDDIFENDYIGGNKNSLVMLPLYVNKVIYGFFLIDLCDDIFENCEFVSSQLSLATRLINLLKK